MRNLTDTRIINWLAQSLNQGVRIQAGETVKGAIPSAYDGDFFDDRFRA